MEYLDQLVSSSDSIFPNLAAPQDLQSPPATEQGNATATAKGSGADVSGGCRSCLDLKDRLQKQAAKFKAKTAESKKDLDQLLPMCEKLQTAKKQLQTENKQLKADLQVRSSL